MPNQLQKPVHESVVTSAKCYLYGDVGRSSPSQSLRRWWHWLLAVVTVVSGLCGGDGRQTNRAAARDRESSVRSRSPHLSPLVTSGLLIISIAVRVIAFRMLARLVVLAVLASMVYGHSYHLGGCPSVEPLPEFEMSKFLGKWYVIQKTSTSSRCLTYNFTTSSEPDEYELEQVSEHPILGLASVDNKYHYTGHLSVPSPDTPAKMVVKFPLSVAGSASYTVFFTDYTTYGAVFTCQKLLNLGNRQSATILSRKKTLDKVYLDKIKGKLSAFGIDPYDLSRIDQSNCPGDNDQPKVDINIDEETFSPQSIAGVVRKAGEKIGDGVEVVAEGAKKLYNAATNDDNKRSTREREEIIENQDKNDAEWLP